MEAVMLKLSTKVLAMLLVTLILCVAFTQAHGGHHHQQKKRRHHVVGRKVQRVHNMKETVGMPFYRIVEEPQVEVPEDKLPEFFNKKANYHP